MSEKQSSQEEIKAGDILKAVQTIQDATVKLAKQDETLQKICNEIKNSESQKGCDFVAIQLIQRDQNVIGTVSGTNWTGIAKHYLDVDPKLRDIQADIVKTGQMEIIAGWDARFDEWLYKKYEHFRLARIFMPIIIVKDSDGGNVHSIENWDEPKDWMDFVDYDWFQSEKKSDSKQEAQCTILTMGKQLSNVQTEIIGTVEVAYRNPESPIEPKTAIALAKEFSEKAVQIYETHLCHVLEVIAGKAIKIVGAAASSLLFRPQKSSSDEKFINYFTEVFAGKDGKKFLQTCPPRSNGIGITAIQEKKTQFVRDTDTDPAFHPEAN